ncbi:MAG: hypothetical protein K2L05_08765, partial [Muribaculaceae bacterium]|nr:hypothetical protein [Muribaculaceae bacterium]
MAVDSYGNTPCWFVLNYVGNSPDRNSAQKIITRFNETKGTDLRLFAPTYVVREEKDGKYRMKTVKLAFHYVFVNGTFDDIKSLCTQQNGFSFLINHSSKERYATISDAEMQHFKNIARAYENCLPYFPLDDIDLEEGDLVEVVNGDFPGLIGTFMPKAKSNSGNIVLMVYNNIGTIAYNIKASDVRVLEFAKQSTRANDQIDAFVPHLLAALNHYKNEQPLPKPLAAKLVVFCQRMEIARLNNNKLNAKLQALLYAGNTILGNIQTAERQREKFNKLKPAISNPWTLA